MKQISGSVGIPIFWAPIPRDCGDGNAFHWGPVPNCVAGNRNQHLARIATWWWSKPIHDGRSCSGGKLFKNLELQHVPFSTIGWVCWHKHRQTWVDSAGIFAGFFCVQQGQVSLNKNGFDGLASPWTARPRHVRPPAAMVGRNCDWVQLKKGVYIFLRMKMIFSYT